MLAPSKRDGLGRVRAGLESTGTTLNRLQWLGPSDSNSADAPTKRSCLDRTHYDKFWT